MNTLCRVSELLATENAEKGAPPGIFVTAGKSLIG